MNQGFLRRNAGWIRAASWALILLSLFVVARELPTAEAIDRVRSWIAGRGVLAPVYFGLLYIGAALLFVPGSLITLAAGAAFGLFEGVVLVSLASTTAAALAFLVARHLARGRVEAAARRRPMFRAIDRAIAHGGWRIIALLRLSPVVPYSLGNYLLGLTGVRFVPYVLASWVFMLPGTFLYVYLGLVGRAGLTAAAGGNGRTPVEWALLAAGLLATAVAVVYTTQLARRKIREELEEEEIGEKEEAMRESGQRVWGTLAVAGLALLCVAGALFSACKKDALQGLFGPPRVKLEEAYAKKPKGPKFDQSLLDELLKAHVREGGWVDYEGLKRDSKKLDRYLAAVAKAPFDAMGRNEKLALLIDAYNACTLRLVLDHYPLKSIRDIPADQRWKGRKWTVGGHSWTLDEMESDQLRSKFEEPRIHFAINCASIGCPPLREEAYTGDRIDSQLQDQAGYCMHHPRWFRFDEGSGVVKLTKLFDWYASDFKQAAGGALAFAARYVPALKRAIDAGKDLRVEWLPYDWTLNSVKNSR